jgi:MoxR-like ATPase
MKDQSEDRKPSEVISDLAARISAAISKTVYGQADTSELLTGALIIGGHVLLEGPPGIAKTLTAKTFAETVGLTFNRIQFTPDLMPSDVTGVYVFDQQAGGTFRLVPGPIFAEIVLADEINRTPPKTQSALLQAMEERFVTIDGKHHQLSPLFLVIATQNPIEHEGTFPLPEAQLDRFIFKLNMSYPPEESEKALLVKFGSEVPVHDQSQNGATLIPGQVPDLGGLPTKDEIFVARRLLRMISLDSSIVDYVYRIVSATRSHKDLILGASPRAALGVVMAGKYQAALDGRDYCIPDDIKGVASAVLAHRLVVQPDVFDSEVAGGKIVQDVLASVAVPRGVH